MKRFELAVRVGLCDMISMATLKDVARRAGVAVSTVSAVVNASAPVSPQMAEKVRAALDALNYVPNSAARSLRSGQSRLIGVVLPDITNPHFAESAQVIEDRCLAAGYTAVFYNTNESTARELRVINALYEQRIAGLILNPTRSDAEHGRAIAAAVKVPVVLMSSAVDGLDAPSVLFDDVGAAQMAADYAIRRGHRRIALLAGRQDVSSGRDRLRGALAACTAHGIPTADIRILPGNFARDEAMRQIQAVMQEAERPSVILAMSAMMTMGALRGLHNLGFRIGPDIAILGIDDFDWADIYPPGITVVAQPVRALAEAAIDRLLGRIRGVEPEAAAASNKPILIARGSCEPAGSAD